MNRDPSVALVALVLMLVAGSVAAIVGALRADRANARRAAAASPHADDADADAETPTDSGESDRT